MSKGAWTALEDKILTNYINAHGEGSWRNLPKKAGLKRCGKSCRLRWLNYLRPDIKRGNISDDEEELIIRLHKLLGNRWSLIAGRLPGRTDNEIKNYWNTTLSKKLSYKNRQNSLPNLKCHSKEKPTSKPSPSQKVVSPPSTTTTTVFRTKAVRCTKPILIDPQFLNVDHVAANDDLDNSSMIREISTDDLVDYNDSNFFYNSGLSSLTSNNNETPQSTNNLTMDGDFSISDLLNSEFSYSPQPQPQPQPQFVFTNEMMEDWAAFSNNGGGCGDGDTNAALNSLSSFLDDAEGDDWLE